MRCFAVRTFVKVGVRTSITYARIDAAWKIHGLEADESPNMGSRLGKIPHACLGEVIRHFIKGRGG